MVSIYFLEDEGAPWRLLPSTWAGGNGHGRVAIGLGKSAWAVADGQGGSLSDSVFNGSLCVNGGIWTVGFV